MSEPAAGAPLVTVAGLAKVFRNGTEALNGVDLEIRSGAFLSLLGPSGCGKSTLLRIIAGLTQPTAGEIAWPARGAGRIGFVFQEPTLMPWATVWDNAYLPLRLLGVARADAAPRIEAALASLGLEGFAQVYPRELSGGMKMRVSIARALATSPRLLLMDEPFAALDEMTRDRMNEELLRLRAEQQWTGVFVTHSVAEAVFLSTRIIVLAPNPGRVHAVLPIDLPFPRTAQLRESDEFEALVGRASHILREALIQ